jgi:hypothetical protein
MGIGLDRRKRELEDGSPGFVRTQVVRWVGRYRLDPAAYRSG